MNIKKITDRQILRCIKNHEVSTCACQERSRTALAKSIRYILDGGNPRLSITKANINTPGFNRYDINNMAKCSDHSSMGGYEYAAFLADELRYNSGMVDTDIEDLLNEKGVKHGSIGRKWLADVMPAILATPLWQEPTVGELACQLSEKYGRPISSDNMMCAICTAVGCKRADGCDWLIRTKREYLHIDDKKPRGYIGRIHNVMLDMGLDPGSEGFTYLRFAVWTVIRSGRCDRRLFMKDVLPVVAQKYGKPKSTIQSAMNTTIRHAAVGGIHTEVIYRLVDLLEPQGHPLYQLADEVLREHGYAYRQKLKGYECLRVAMVKLAENKELFDLGIYALMQLVDKELGYGGYYCAGRFFSLKSYSMANFFSKPFKEYQAAGSLINFIHQMGKELCDRAKELQVA